MTITLKQGDCLELMKELPDESVDAVITDPPYGINYLSPRTTNHRKQYLCIPCESEVKVPPIIARRLHWASPNPRVT